MSEQETSNIEPPFANFREEEKRNEWLSSRERNVVSAIAVRSALRLIPLFSLASMQVGSRLSRRRTLLRMFRAASTSWAVCCTGDELRKRKLTSSGLLVGLSDIRLSPTERAVAYAFATVVESDAEFADRASVALRYGTDLRSFPDKGAAKAAHDSARIDASLLD